MRSLILVVSLSLIALIGCNKGSTLDTQLIDGTITLDGAPLSKANITFYPESGGEIASAYSDEQGKFSVSSQNGTAGQGALAGQYSITVSKVEAKFVSANLKSDPEAGRTETKELLPQMYQDKAKTPLKAEITKGENILTLELKSK